MSSNFSVQILCKDDETRTRYQTLAVKMNDDSEFKSRLCLCKSDEQVYELYKNRGYTDLCFEDFKVQFSDLIYQLNDVTKPENFELTDEELENVVGGFNLFTFITNVVSAIPIAGPLIAGVARGVKAAVEGKSASEVVLQIATGLGGTLIDSVVWIATAGIGSAWQLGFRLGMMGVKAGLNEAMNS